MPKAERILKVKKTFVFGAAGTSQTDLDLTAEGLIMNMIIDVPAFTNNVTAEVIMKDADGFTYYKSGSLLKSSLNQVDVQNGIGTDGFGKVGCSISSDAGGAGGTVTVIMFVWQFRY